MDPNADKQMPATEDEGADSAPEAGALGEVPVVSGGDGADEPAVDPASKPEDESAAAL